MIETTAPYGDVWPDLGTPPNRLKARILAPAAKILLHRLATRFGFSIAEDGSTDADMIIHRPREFYARLGTDGLIGLGESYMCGAWDSEDLGSLFTLLCAHISELVPRPLQRLRGIYVNARPAGERNTVQAARNNIARHYDLSHELFASFLDETLSYSAALYPAESDCGGNTGSDNSDGLEGAQIRKVERILDQANIGPGTRLLEIGTGWAELAIRAAHRGASVYSITLSAEQRDYAAYRVACEGLEGRVHVELQDYRDIDPCAGQFDAVISVEMIEAVGKEYLPAFFKQMNQLLAPGGRAVLQVITMPHRRMIQTRNTWTWITKYIFPGGFIPSLLLLSQMAARHTSLRLIDTLSFGPDYAATLAEWDARFLAAREHVLAQGFDAIFVRMWHFYLQYSRAGFAANYLEVNQLTWEQT